MATETFRPNAPGDECNIPDEAGCSACPAHHDCVDEAVADDTTTQVRDDSSSSRDLYNIPAPTGSGSITHVKVYARICGIGYGGGGNASPIIKSNGTVTEGDNSGDMYGLGWTTFSTTWALNPADGQPWTWEDIDALQIGVKVSVGACTQVYAEVDYLPPVPPEEGFTASDRMAMLIKAGVI